MSKVNVSNRDLHQHYVFVKEPHPHSMASLVLLRKFFYKQDVDNNLYWLKFRDKYIKKHKRKAGIFNCDYCGKKNLKNNSKHQKATVFLTLDHAHPLSRGGKRFEENNIRLACNKCNQAKQDMEEWEFRWWLLQRAWKNRQYGNEYKGVLKSTIRGFLKLTSIREFVRVIA